MTMMESDIPIQRSTMLLGLIYKDIYECLREDFDLSFGRKCSEDCSTNLFTFRSTEASRLSAQRSTLTVFVQANRKNLYIFGADPLVS